MAPSLQHQALDWFSTCFTSPKSTKSLLVRDDHSLPVPPTGLDRVSVWSSPRRCCSYGCAAHCVYVALVTHTIYPSKSLPIRVGGFPVWHQGSAPGREGAIKMHFLTDLSSAAGTLHSAFPPQLIKSLGRWCKASSILLGFKNSYQLTFH